MYRPEISTKVLSLVFEGPEEGARGKQSDAVTNHSCWRSSWRELGYDEWTTRPRFTQKLVSDRE